MTRTQLIEYIGELYAACRDLREQLAWVEDHGDELDEYNYSNQLQTLTAQLADMEDLIADKEEELYNL